MFMFEINDYEFIMVVFFIAGSRDADSVGSDHSSSSLHYSESGKGHSTRYSESDGKQRGSPDTQPDATGSVEQTRPSLLSDPPGEKSNRTTPPDNSVVAERLVCVYR